MSVIPLQREIYYPESDGQPMAETDVHRREMMYLIDALGNHFRGVPDVYVAGNLFLYYKQGDIRSAVAPDVFMVRGVPKGDRRVYKLWEEGHPPCLVVEVTSRHTWAEDLSRKKTLYERLGVEEYFLHDPERDEPTLQGFRLVEGRYQSLEPGRDGSLTSRVTDLILQPVGSELRLVDAATGKPLLAYEESEAARRAAEEEVTRLRAEIERLREAR